jgi:hypothetical protein
MFHFYACFIKMFTASFPVTSIRFTVVSGVYIPVVHMVFAVIPCGDVIEYLHRSPCES